MDQAQKAMTLRIIMVTAGDAPFGDFMGRKSWLRTEGGFAVTFET